MSAPSTEQITRISIHVLREEGDCPPRLSRPQIRHFYPRPPRGGRHVRAERFFRCKNISIHALREEGDRTAIGYRLKGIDISIHALREEGDHCVLGLFFGQSVISIHALREEGDPSVFRGPLWGAISIHALREEGDCTEQRQRRYIGHFYPRPPRGGRLVRTSTAVVADVFLSTPSARRATRMETSAFSWSMDFYPRPPRGGRQTGYIRR